MFDEDGTIVNYDLVLPAFIYSYYKRLKVLDGYKDNKKDYLGVICLTLKQIEDYAIKMKSWILGRVVVNFDAKEVLNFLQSHPELFKPFDSESNYFKHNENTFFSLVIPEDIDPEEYVINIINDMTSHINYPKRVLRAVGLLYDTKEEVVSVEDKVSKANYHSEAGSKMLHKVKKEY